MGNLYLSLEEKEEFRQFLILFRKAGKISDVFAVDMIVEMSKKGIAVIILTQGSLQK